MPERGTCIEPRKEPQVRNGLSLQVFDIKRIILSEAHGCGAFAVRMDPRLDGFPEQTRMPQ